MKTINNTCKEVLPSLLDKSKCQTIRKAWTTEHDGDGFNAPSNYWNEAKPAKYEVGEIVELVWDGQKTIIQEWYNDKPNEIFKLSRDNILGKVRITEVFKIKIECNLPNYDIEVIEGEATDLCLYERDGFKSDIQMLRYLDEAYDLSTPKEFWVYRWEWI